MTIPTCPLVRAAQAAWAQEQAAQFPALDAATLIAAEAAAAVAACAQALVAFLCAYPPLAGCGAALFATAQPHPLLDRAGATIAVGPLCFGYSAVAGDPPYHLLLPAHTATGYTLDPTALQPGDLAQLGAVLATHGLPFGAGTEAPAA